MERLFLAFNFSFITLGTRILFIYSLEVSQTYNFTYSIYKEKLPHQVALAKIAKLKHTPLNNQEEQKVYYTLLTDILREYLFKRFAINAKEMTSSQILSNLQKIDPKGNEELRAVFETSDLVKFAKYTVHEGNDENKYLGCVINFIQKQSKKINQRSKKIRIR